MKITKSAIPEVLTIEPKVFPDDRGYFAELYQADRYSTYGIRLPFVQDNISRSTKGVLRGLHFQDPNAQGKLVTVLRGSVLDVAVDLRVASPTFGQHVSAELNDQNHCQFWIPRGFAHGFLVLSEIVDLLYKCDDFYSPQDEVVLRWNDPNLGIHWACTEPIVSARDRDGLSLAQIRERLSHSELSLCVS